MSGFDVPPLPYPSPFSYPHECSHRCPLSLFPVTLIITPLLPLWPCSYLGVGVAMSFLAGSMIGW